MTLLKVFLWALFVLLVAVPIFTIALIAVQMYLMGSPL
jgi:hypothetical protein